MSTRQYARSNRFHPSRLAACLALRFRACLTLASVDCAVSVARYNTYVFMLLLIMAGSAVAGYKKVSNTKSRRTHMILKQSYAV